MVNKNKFLNFSEICHVKTLLVKGEEPNGGALRLYLVQAISYSSLVLSIQPIQFTYIWLPLSKMHTLDDTVPYFKFTNILQ